MQFYTASKDEPLINK